MSAFKIILKEHFIVLFRYSILRYSVVVLSSVLFPHCKLTGWFLCQHPQALALKFPVESCLVLEMWCYVYERPQEHAQCFFSPLKMQEEHRLYSDEVNECFMRKVTTFRQLPGCPCLT